MPTDEKVLGFGNQWYQPALENAMQIDLPSEKSIYLVTAPYFLMTKFAAFEGRGGGDYLMSHDIEDIVALLDGRRTIVEDVQNADDPGLCYFFLNALMNVFTLTTASARRVVASKSG